ncbi:hypothetical protein GCM10027168_36550 [Streptomyces capparidis]
MAAEQCSVCGAGLDTDGRPLCDCAPLTAEEAVAAAFDSFRPMRVRPYIASNDDIETRPPEPRRSLIGDPGGTGPDGPAPAPGPAAPGLAAPGLAAPGAAGPGGEFGGGPNAEDVSLFPEPEPGPAGHGGAEPEPEPAGEPRDSGDNLPVLAPRGDSTALVVRTAPRRTRQARTGRRRGVAAAAAAAVLGVGAIAFLTGMGGGDGKDDHALPRPTDAVPTAATPDDPADPTDSPSASRSGSPSPSASASSSASESPSASGSAAASPSSSARPTRDAGGGISVPSPSDDGGGGGGGEEDEETQKPVDPGPPVLREGDSGPEVEELQQRLKQVYALYWGTVDGEYDGEVADWVARFQRDRGIEADPEGVYGHTTRRALEAETEEP